MNPRRALTLALAPWLAACALPFPEYDLVGEGTSAGGAGGASTEATGGSPRGADGAPCATNAECQSGNCVDSAGASKICCVTACDVEGPTSCGTNGSCDLDGKACSLYPDGTACSDDSSCIDATETRFECRAGACAKIDERCANGLECEPTMKACKATCVTSADCATPGAACIGEVCQLGPGEACADNSECASEICGIMGVGTCCVAPCVSSGACGADDCDATGACAYPPPTATCSPLATCEDGLLTANYCDGAGTCGSAPETQPCVGNFACASPLACDVACESNDAAGDARCAPAYWCNGSACKADLPKLGLCTRASQCVSGHCYPISPPFPALGSWCWD